MRSLPIRVRLTLAFVLAVAVVLAAAGLFVYLRVASDLAAALDNDLRSRAQDVSALVLHRGSLRAPGRALVEPGESFAQLLDADGRVLAATTPSGSTPLRAPSELARARVRPAFTKRPSEPRK